MEQNQQTSGSSLFSLNIDANSNSTLSSAASWAKILAIVGFILGVLFVIFGLLVQGAVSRNGGFGTSTSTIGAYGMIVYIIMGIVMIISSVFALNFSNKVSAALKANDQASLSAGFGGARNYFAFWAVLCIIFLLLLLISLVSLMGR